MSNLGWLFYKDYFKGIDYTDLGSSGNEDLVQRKIARLIATEVSPDSDEMLGNIHLQATTTYPGLLLGSGNAHELPGVEGQAILGFHFDYTSGLPTIPGSSLKGVLRSAFEHPGYIAECIGKEVDIEALEEEIFVNGDIFFDAVVISGGKILADDYLTPHGDDPLKDPKPLRFVKVMPGVTFRFDFGLSDGILTKGEKAKLFEQILDDLGLGAKTNVGYGKFVDFKRVQTPEELEAERAQREEARFAEAIEAKDLEKLEAFKRDFPHSTKDVTKALEDIKRHLKRVEIQRSCDNLDKTNKKHVDAFIAKYKDDPDAQPCIEQLRADTQSVQAPLCEDFATLIAKTQKYKALENIVKRYIATQALSEEEKRVLETHIQTQIKEKIKRKKFPFGTFGNEKCLGKERANALADRLGLK